MLTVSVHVYFIAIFACFFALFFTALISCKYLVLVQIIVHDDFHKTVHQKFRIYTSIFIAGSLDFNEDMHARKHNHINKIFEGISWQECCLK